MSGKNRLRLARDAEEEAIEDNSHNFEDLYDYEDSMDHDASSTANQVLPPVPHNVVAPSNPPNVVAPSNPPLFVAVNERGASTANQVFVPANEIRGRRLVDSDGKENSEGLGENVYDFDYIFEKDANGRRVVNPNAVTLRLVQAAEKKKPKICAAFIKIGDGKLVRCTDFATLGSPWDFCKTHNQQTRRERSKELREEGRKEFSRLQEIQRQEDEQEKYKHILRQNTQASLYLRCNKEKRVNDIENMRRFFDACTADLLGNPSVVEPPREQISTGEPIPQAVINQIISHLQKANRS